MMLKAVVLSSLLLAPFCGFSDSACRPALWKGEIIEANRKKEKNGETKGIRKARDACQKEENWKTGELLEGGSSVYRHLTLPSWSFLGMVHPAGYTLLPRIKNEEIPSVRAEQKQQRKKNEKDEVYYPDLTALPLATEQPAVRILSLETTDRFEAGEDGRQTGYQGSLSLASQPENRAESKESPMEKEASLEMGTKEQKESQKEPNPAEQQERFWENKETSLEQADEFRQSEQEEESLPAAKIVIETCMGDQTRLSLYEGQQMTLYMSVEQTEEYPLQEQEAAFSAGEGSPFLNGRRIDPDRIGYDFMGDFCAEFLQALSDRKAKLYYKGNLQEAKDSLSEIVSVFCAMKGSVGYFAGKDEKGTWLEILPEDQEELFVQVEKALQGWEAYKEVLKTCCTRLPLQADDPTLLDALNELICSTFTYEVTNEGMQSFVTKGKGQCWHFAKFFHDMCQTLGYESRLAGNMVHKWVKVQVQGVEYDFDPTYNATCGSSQAYSWQQTISDH